MGNRCAFRIDFLGESSEDVGTDFVDPDQIRNPNYIEGFTNFVNEVNQGLEEYENELEGKQINEILDKIIKLIFIFKNTFFFLSRKVGCDLSQRLRLLVSSYN